MITITLDFRDESLIECLNDIISGLLPHDNYSPESFDILYTLLSSVLDIGSVRGIYYLFFVVFEKYKSLALNIPKGQYEVAITRDRFSNALANNLPDLILEPATNVQEIMAEEGKSSDISIPTVQQEIMGTLYEKTMALYDDCFALQRSKEDAMSRIVDLKDVIKANLIETGLSIQRTIVSTGLRQGRKFYRGANGWLQYVQTLARELSELETSSDGDMVCDSIDIVTRLDESTDDLAEPLAGYGIPQLDAQTPMLRHRLVVFVARENTGKTQIVLHLIATLIRAGVKPFFACGEAPKGLMFNCIVSSYIFQEYGMFFEPRHLSGEGFAELSDEDKQIVNTAKSRVASSGLVISDDLEYDNVYAKISHYHNLGCDAFFIDHTQSLRGRKGRDMKDLVAGLALDCRELKKTLPIFICLTSQPSTGLKEHLQKDNNKSLQISPTAQSSVPAYEADEVFIISDSDYLKTQGLLSWSTYKTRWAERCDTFYILKRFEVSSYIYDAKYQGVEAIDEDTLEGTINRITDFASDDDDDDDDDEITITF